jgi:hypothetical protein
MNAGLYNPRQELVCLRRDQVLRPYTRNKKTVFVTSAWNLNTGPYGTKHELTVSITARNVISNWSRSTSQHRLSYLVTYVISCPLVCLSVTSEGWHCNSKTWCAEDYGYVPADLLASIIDLLNTRFNLPAERKNRLRGFHGRKRLRHAKREE